MHCHRMSHQMWENPTFGQLRIRPRSDLGSELQPLSESDACQWPTHTIWKERLLGRPWIVAQPALELASSIGPQRHGSFLSSFATDPNRSGRFEYEVSNPH